MENGLVSQYGGNHARIGWAQTGLVGKVIASGAAAGYAATNAATPTEYDFWKPANNSETWEVNTYKPKFIQFCGIAAHTLGSSGSEVIFQTWDGSAWETIDRHSPLDDSAFMFLCNARLTPAARIRVICGNIPFVGVIQFGPVIELPQRVYAGSPTPIDLGIQTTFKENISQAGAFVGRTVERVRSKSQFSVSNLPESYVRNTLKPFIEYSQQYPFFLAERPQDYPDAVDYVRTEADITPSRAGVLDHMDLTL
jgi:hypothetical protein